MGYTPVWTTGVLVVVAAGAAVLLLFILLALLLLLFSIIPISVFCLIMICKLYSVMVFQCVLEPLYVMS